MGILSDFFVARAEEAELLASTTGRKQWDVFESKGFTHLEVAHLHFIITGLDPDALVSPPRFERNRFTGAEIAVSAFMEYMDAFKCLVDGEEQWVHEVPATLVEEIVNAAYLPSIAKKWAACEELQPAEPEDLHNVLVELQRLARLARAEQKSILLWTSL